MNYYYNYKLLLQLRIIITIMSYYYDYKKEVVEYAKRLLQNFRN